MNCGLLGRKLGHSYSPQIHQHFGDYSYRLFEKEPEDIADFILNGDFNGINVTIPYKKDVLPFCSELSDTAKKLGAVNTIVRKKDGRIVGHNTDYFGFMSMVKKSGLHVAGKKVLILGSGGASATAQAVLKELHANFVVISRMGENNYQNLDLHSDASLIINCTPVGMYPNPGVSPIDISLFPMLEGVLDMIYNPARTKLLMDAEQRNLISMNGLWMLVAQAKDSAEWFMEKKLDDSIIEAVYQFLISQMHNIILVGMPGCGKSTVGKLLSKKLNKQFVDADEEICTFSNRTIPEIFQNDGEATFRSIETEVLCKLGMKSGIVLATGGGCVTKDRNYPLLHQNGTIVWIQRDLSKLDKKGRPLSSVTTAEEMFAHRRPMYERFADLTVENNGEPKETVSRIIQLLGAKL